MDYRVEEDLLGTGVVPQRALYGIHTARALENFPFGRQTVHPELISAIATVKQAAARVLGRLGWLSQEKSRAIAEAAQDVASGADPGDFPLSAWQGGAGTSTHLNVCEIIANRAIIKLGGQPGEYGLVHPIDDVNMFQSTNDVYPTALRIAAIRRLRRLSDACSHLQTALQAKEAEFADVLKLGRTELQDAVPITLGQEFSAYAQAIGRDRWRLYKAEERLRQINLGGTAVGTGLGAPWEYIYAVSEELRQLTGIGLARAENMVDPTQNMDVFVEVSGLVKTSAVSLAKIARDLRLLASGPAGGLGEIALPPRQAGSSLMPGKVNPVIPEAVQLVAYQVMAHDHAVTLAAQSGELELNAMVPLIAHALLESLELMTDAVTVLADQCVAGITARREDCRENLDRSTAAATAIAMEMGYDAASRLVKEAQRRGVDLKTVVLEEDSLQLETVEAIFSLDGLTHPGQQRGGRKP